ncbi:hypothetical protein L596_025011 [Steinernema carpocapsae]|uniref:Protein arginine N-methyltransferase n=1 Tax=Steinernema carpocapsae TaxID=34508 RepID=A0A4U5M6I7_STECR|nr:hypothetical protein L596_025011 [Steinernema carpocapsae]
MFIERINNATGDREWVVTDEGYDLAQEIARSGFADMILDTERNQLYEKGLRTVIAEKHAKGEEANVVDIGTGTGLLSLMAARAGADYVKAIEVFKPMADIARKILKSSEYADRIDLITTRSTDINSTAAGSKGNIIVAEVFDTELIGEGALRTFKEAHNTLVGPGTRVVPSSGNVYILPVESVLLKKFNKMPHSSLKSPYEKCPGTASVFDVQLSEIDKNSVKPLCEPFLAFSFNFENAESINYDESFLREAVATQSGSIDAILMWWNIDMDGTGAYIINMAPKWIYPASQWRDHWMQAVYYLPEDVQVNAGEKIAIQCSHDEFSLWFTSARASAYDKHNCECEAHVICARNSLFRMNDVDSDTSLKNLLKKECTGKDVLVVNEGSLIGLTTAEFAKSVTVVDTNPHFRGILQGYSSHNKLANVVIISSFNEVSQKPDLIVGEPFYLSSMLPWNNLRFWYDTDAMRKRFNAKIDTLIKNFVLYAIPLNFEHLWKIASPVGTVEGFDLSRFDDVCQTARFSTDAIVEPQPLWEYPSVCTGETVELVEFDLSQEIPAEEITFDATIEFGQDTNGVALWCDWQSSSDFVVQTGLLEDCKLGGTPVWNKGYRQGVYFMPQARRLDPECRKLLLQGTFNQKNGEISFYFAY